MINLPYGDASAQVMLVRIPSRQVEVVPGDGFAASTMYIAYGRCIAGVDVIRGPEFGRIGCRAYTDPAVTRRVEWFELFVNQFKLRPDRMSPAARDESRR